MKKVYLLAFALLNILAFSQEKEKSKEDSIRVQKEIEQINIISKKKVIEQKVDRLVFNVEQSIVANGVDALEVLQRTPKVDITNGGIKLVGKSGLGIMINGKLLHLSGSDIENYLKNIRSENISKIEVITMPPAKYDSQGNSGLINIILKRNANEGWRGYISSAYVQRSYSGFIPSASMFYNSQKISLALSLSGDRESKKSTSLTDIDFDSNYRNANEIRKESSKGLTTGVNFSYNINENNTVGVIYNSNFWDIRQNGVNENRFFTKSGNVLNSIQNSPFYNKNSYNYHSLSSYYDLKLDSLGKKMSVNFSFLNKNNKNNRDFSTSNYLGNYNSLTSNNQSINDNRAKYNVYALNLDFTLPYEFADVEAGAKMTFIENNSKVDFYNKVAGNQVFDTTKSNQFDYKEMIAALYVSAEKPFGDLWTAQVGLRYEHTATKGNSLTINEKKKNYFDNLFPTAYLMFEPNENHSFSLSYTKRIERPSFAEVNPFRIYSDFYSYEAGNPYLLPSISHNLEFSYIFKNNLSFTLYGSKLERGRDYLTIANENSNSIISTPQNYYTQNTIGVDVSYNYKPFEWFDSFNSFSAFYNDSKSYVKLVTNPDFKGYGAYFSTKNTFTLNANKTTFLLMNFFQSFPTSEGFIKSYNRASLDLGLRFSFLKKKLNASVIAYDIFAQNRNKVTEIYPNYRYSSMIYNDMRNITLSVTYRFGNSKVKVNNRRIQNTEAERM